MFEIFSLNEYDLRILSSVFLMEIFDLRGKELKYAKELLLNHYSKSVHKFYEVAGHAGGVKKLVTNNLRNMFRSHIHNATERNTAATINLGKLIETRAVESEVLSSDSDSWQFRLSDSNSDSGSDLQLY